MLISGSLARSLTWSEGGRYSFILKYWYFSSYSYLRRVRGYYRHISKIFVSSVFRMPRFTGMTMHDLSPDAAPRRIEKDYRMIDSDCCADLESSMQCTCTCTAVLESTKFPCMPGLRRERSIKPFKPRSQAAAHKQQNVSIDTLMG